MKIETTNTTPGTFRHIKQWTLPDHYAGEVWPDWYMFLCQHRESDALTRSNFACGLAKLGGESDTVRVVRERHWAVGWVEWIAVHGSDAKALAAADEMLAALEVYPVLDDDHYSELEWNEANDYWASLPVSDRVGLCREAGLSIFAARRGYIPEGDDSGLIYDRLRG